MREERKKKTGRKNILLGWWCPPLLLLLSLSDDSTVTTVKKINSLYCLRKFLLNMKHAHIPTSFRRAGSQTKRKWDAMYKFQKKAIHVGQQCGTPCCLEENPTSVRLSFFFSFSFLMATIHNTPCIHRNFEVSLRYSVWLVLETRRGKKRKSVWQQLRASRSCFSF